MARNLLTELPNYPWDQLRPIAEKAASHPDGVIDLSIGSPVDPVPAVIREALAEAGNAPGYPTAAGTAALRTALVSWWQRRRRVNSLTGRQVLATVGSKEFIALLPMWLGMGSADVMVQPRVHYPAYSVGSDLVEAQVVSEDDPAKWPKNTTLIWINSPGNPDGVVHDIDFLRSAIARAREIGAVLVQDECYAELGWSGPWSERPIPCLLEDAVTDGDLSGLLSIYSLSKQSNLAGYRAGLVAGCATLIAGLTNVRKQAGLAVPAPIQAAMVAALNDDRHVQVQKDRYRARRERLLPAVKSWGLTVEQSHAGLYLWATAGQDAWQTLDQLADLGILAGPGNFYGEHSTNHVRLSLTASDEHIAEASRRLTAAQVAR